jgi:iron complex outermembrane receptor protein
VATSDFHATRNNTPSFFDWQTGGITLNVRWDINDLLTLTSVSGYRAWDSDFLFNTDGTEIEVTRTTQVYDTRQWSQEFQLTGKHERLNWIAGLYYLKEEKFGALGLVRLNPATPFSFNIFDDNTGKAWAAFGQLDFELTDRLTLIAGLRYSDEEKDDFNRQYQVLQSATNPRGRIELGLFGGLTLPATTLGAPRDRSDSWDATTPKVGLQFQATDDAMLYATWSKGFKSGGYNGFQPNNPVYDPEFIKSIEIGAKTEWLDGRLRLNAAIFDYDYEDLQVSAFLNSLTVTSNAADSTVRGAELDLTWKPNSQLQLGASLAFLDAKYDEYAATYGICTLVAINSGDAPCAGVTPMAPAAARVIDASGNRLNNAPKFKGLLSADYEIPVPSGGKVTLFGTLSHTDDIFFNAANDPVTSQTAYTVLDARVAWSNADETIELAIYGKNLSDEDYFHNIVQFTSTSLPPAANALPAPGQVITDPLSIGHALGYAAPGRQFGVDFTYRFGNR